MPLSGYFGRFKAGHVRFLYRRRFTVCRMLIFARGLLSWIALDRISCADFAAQVCLSSDITSAEADRTRRTLFGDPSSNRVRYLTPPEVFVQEIGGADLVPPGTLSFVPPFVDTGPIDAQNFHLFAAEGGLTLGSLYMQSEAIYSVVNQTNGPQVSFAGAYVYAGYFLTGEIRPFNREKGVFGRVKPISDFTRDKGLGAWEVAGRWSYIDLNDKNIEGGRMNDLTFGLNWYLNQRTKFQFNYIHAFLDNPVFGESNANIFALRGQVDF